jgi:arginine decarboxylase
MLEQGSVFHLQGGLVDPAVLKSREDLLGTTSPSVLLYAALDGWRRQMVEHGRVLYGKALALAGAVREELGKIEGLHLHGRDDFCGPGKAADLDPLQLVIDIAALGITGYRAADWLREQHRINLHLADHRRISAQLTHADNGKTAAALISAVRDLVAQEKELRAAGSPAVEVPGPAQLRLEQVMLPRDAFFGPTEQAPWEEAVGRISAEMLTPYPPGIPCALPGERLTAEVMRYLRTGVDAGMVVPDAADAGVHSVRVVREE